MYYIWRSFAMNKTLLPTEDLLEAVKISMNYEADLYRYGTCLASWLGLPMEENIKHLEEKGIEVYVVNNNYRFRYKDPAKNIKRMYYRLAVNDQTKQGELHVSDTPSYKDQAHYPTLEAILEVVKEHEPDLEVLTIIDFSGDTYEGSYKKRLKDPAA